MLTINNRDKLDWRQGMTVSEMLAAMGYSYALITVTVNGEVVEKDEYETYRIPDGADVNVFHLAHGG
ncbi:MAG: sulfur carrier protein ThiS [Candidatus Eisenbacteria bacterium]